MNRHGALNRIYRLVWSQVTNSFVAVAENAKSRGKGKNYTRKLFAAALSLSAVTWLMQDALAGPTAIGKLVSGPASVTQTGSVTTITQSTQQALLNWNSFNVGAGQTVNFTYQPGIRFVSVNEISGSNGSTILGTVNAPNGELFLINPNGVYFGKGAQVNVGGLVASALGMSGTDSSGMHFSGQGKVDNQGTITAGSHVVLLGSSVTNEGSISSAPLGTIILSAGNDATLTMNNNVRLKINKSTVQNLVSNSGLIQADGGAVVMTAGAVNELLASVVNNTGVIEARTVGSHHGTISLLADMGSGFVNVGGTLDVSAPNDGDGGVIETSAGQVKMAAGFAVNASAAHGKTGSWLIDPNDFNIAASGGDVTGADLSSALVTSDITILTNNTGVSCSATINCGSGSPTPGNGDINVSDPVSWGSAHALTLNAWNNINVNQPISVTGSGALNFMVGQSAANSGNMSIINFNAPINLASNSTFTTKLGNDLSIAPIKYIIINSVGSSTDVNSNNGTLQGMVDNSQPSSVNNNYVLGSDLDALATKNWNGGAGFAPIGSGPSTGGVDGNAFLGSFNGLGHTISNLYINRPSQDYVGLFARSVGNIGNVTLTNAAVTGQSTVGGLAGDAASGVTNSHVSGNVTGSAVVGGLIGQGGGTITGSDFTGTVTGLNYTGGLLGAANFASIINSHASGSVFGGINVGGIVGQSLDSTIQNCYATGSVSGFGFVGGLVGFSAFTNIGSSISNSYANESITDIAGVAGYETGNFGGLVGRNADSSIDNSHASGSINITQNFSYIGGLVGFNIGGVITKSYSDASVTATNSTSVGGLVGVNINDSSSAAATISGSFATGAVSGFSAVGGFIGTNQSGNVSDSYASGAVTGVTTVGGMIGDNYASVSNLYSAGSVTGSSSVGGLIGSNNNRALVASSFWDLDSNPGLSGSIDGVGLRLADIHTQANFSSAGWSFGSKGTWFMYEGLTMPLLQSFMTPVTVTAANILTNYTGVQQTPQQVVWSTGSQPTNNVFGRFGYYDGLRLGGLNAGTYSIGGLWSNQLGYLINYNGGNLTISPAPISYTGVLTPVSRAYDGTAVVALSGVPVFSGLVNNETFGVTGILSGVNAGSESVTLALLPSPNGTGLVSNYTLASGVNLGTVNISKADVTITKFFDKQYDGTTTVPLSFLVGYLNSGTLYFNQSTGQSDRLSLSGTLTYASPNVLGQNGSSLLLSGGTGFSVMDGNGGLNYNLTMLTPATITPAPITLTVGAAVKTYDGSTKLTSIPSISLTEGSIFSPDSLTTGGTLSYVSKDALGTNNSQLTGTDLTVVDGNNGKNYQVTVNNTNTTINPAGVSITGGLVAGSRNYDGTNLDIITGTARFSGLVPGENLTATGTVQLPSINAAASEAVQVTSMVLGDGTSGMASNYFLTSFPTLPNVTISPAPITVGFGPSSKTYDGTRTVIGTPTLAVVSGQLFPNADQGNALDTLSGGSFIYQSANALGTGGSTVNATGVSINDGNGGQNYQLTVQSSSPANGNGSTISPATLIATLNPVAKVYDGTKGYTGATTYTLNSGEQLFTNIENNNAQDSLTGGIFSYQSAYVLGKGGSAVNVTGVSVNDGNGGQNYQLTVLPSLPTTNNGSTIMPAPLTASLNGVTKVYDGTQGFNGVATYTLNSGQQLFKNIDRKNIQDSLVGGSFTYQSANVLGSGASEVDVTGVSVNDGNGGKNYQLTVLPSLPSTNNGSTITPAPLSIAVNPVTKTYDGTLAFNGTPTYSISGSLFANASNNNSVDTLVAGSFAYESANVKGAAGSIVDASGFSVNDGNYGKNYQITTVSSSPANNNGSTILPAALELSFNNLTKVYDGTFSVPTTVSDPTTLFKVVNGPQLYNNVSNSGKKDQLVNATFIYQSPNVLPSSTVLGSVQINDGNGGNNYTVTVDPNTTSTITPEQINIGYNAPTKVYDGTTSLYNGKQPGPFTVGAGQQLYNNQSSGQDNITATLAYNSANVLGTNGSTANVTGLQINDGNGGNNYTILSAPAVIKGTITPAPVTILFDGVTKIYDGTPNVAGVPANINTGSQGLFGTDSLTGTGSSPGTFAFTGKDVMGAGGSVVVGSGYVISDGNGGKNYAVTEQESFGSTINKAQLYVVGETAQNKPYDGSATATLTGGKLSLTSGVQSVPALYGNDGSNITLTPSGKFANIGPGNGIAVAATDMITGTAAIDYNLNETQGLTANITAASKIALTVKGETVITKFYDGKPIAYLTGGVLVGAASTDDVHLVQTGTYASVNATCFTSVCPSSAQIAVTVNDTLTGADAGKYTLTEPTHLVGYIRPEPVLVVGTAKNKVYDGTTTATLINQAILGVVPTEQLNFNESGKFISPNVSTANASFLNVSVVDSISAGTGTLLSNYFLTDPAYFLPALMTPATLTYVAKGMIVPVGAKTFPTATGIVTGFVNNSQNITNATHGTLLWTPYTKNTSKAGVFSIIGSGLTANFGDYTFVQANDRSAPPGGNIVSDPVNKTIIGGNNSTALCISTSSSTCTVPIPVQATSLAIADSVLTPIPITNGILAAPNPFTNRNVPANPVTNGIVQTTTLPNLQVIDGGVKMPTGTVAFNSTP